MSKGPAHMPSTAARRSSGGNCGHSIPVTQTHAHTCNPQTQTPQINSRIIILASLVKSQLTAEFSVIKKTLMRMIKMTVMRCWDRDMNLTPVLNAKRKSLGFWLWVGACFCVYQAELKTFYFLLNSVHLWKWVRWESIYIRVLCFGPQKSARSFSTFRNRAETLAEILKSTLRIDLWRSEHQNLILKSQQQNSVEFMR